jgi:hypothetical protein
MELVELREQITERMLQGATLDETDAELIVPSAQSDDAKAALWLWAWHLVPQQQQRTLAIESMGALLEGFRPDGDGTAEKLAEVTAAVRDHEAEQRRTLIRVRSSDEELYRRIRRATS